MTESHQGSPAGRDAIIVVVHHTRRLVTETLAIALSGLGFRTTFDAEPAAALALVDTTDTGAIERLTAAGVPVLAFGSSDPVTEARARRAGAVDHVADSVGVAEIGTRITRLAVGKQAPPPAARPEVRLLDRLTRREREVLRGLVSGRRAADIADADFVSVTTVRNQIQSILTKLDAHSQLEAVAIAVRAGWTPLAA